MERLTVRPKEAAKMIDVGNTTIYELIKAGLIPAIKMGNSYKVSVDGLRRYVNDTANAQAEERRKKCQE